MAVRLWHGRDTGHGTVAVRQGAGLGGEGREGGCVFKTPCARRGRGGLSYASRHRRPPVFGSWRFVTGSFWNDFGLILTLGPQVRTDTFDLLDALWQAFYTDIRDAEFI